MCIRLEQVCLLMKYKSYNKFWTDTISMNKKEKEQQPKNVDFLQNGRIQIYSHGFKLKFNDTNQSKTYTNWSSKDFCFMMNTQLIKSNQLDRERKLPYWWNWELREGGIVEEQGGKWS